MIKVVLLAGLVSAASAFYLPGVAPRDYKKGDKVELLVNALSSPSTVLPYDQYHPQLHFCEPDGGPKAQGESLGAILFGDRLYDSRFQLNMLENKACQKLCSGSVTVNPEDAKFINSLIKSNYVLNWVVDGLPFATITNIEGTDQEIYNLGFTMGEVVKDTPTLYNHFAITIEYNTADRIKHRVVGVTVDPKSTFAYKDCKLENTGDDKPVTLSESSDTTFTYTYSVTWVESSTKWSSRWENFLSLNNSALEPRIHWFSLINSIIIVLFLSGMIGMILIRALHKDIARYNALQSEEDAQEDFGWKLAHGDVFRAPNFRMLLTVLVGSGAQLLVMASVTLVFAVLGFLSPSSRGSLTTVMLVFYVLFGSIAGYYSARLYKMLGGEKWRRNVLLTASLVPGFIMFIFLSLNFFLIYAKSSSAVPFGTIIALFALWFLVSAPLCAVGAYFGFKKPKIENPVRTNQIPRQIPEQPFYLQFLPEILLGGILPFGAIFIELFFIMNSIWTHKIYYVFGFLFVVFLILILTCSEIAILLCYFQLCAENYHWWWRSFLASGSSAFYVFLYGIIYFVTRTKIDSGPSTVLYFGWTLVMSFLVFVITGTIGFVSCFYFVRRIYASIKID